MQENYFNELEKKEQLEDKMKTITEIKVKVVCCKQVRKSFCYHLSFTKRAVIGQFSVPYSAVPAAKIYS